MISSISHQTTALVPKTRQHPQRSHTPVHFGWHAEDKADLLSTSHFVVDETNLSDFFSGITKKSELPRLPRSLPQPPNKLVKKMAKQLANTEGSRFIALDVSDELGISPNIIWIYFQHLQSAIQAELKDVYFDGRNVEAPMAFPGNGIESAREISKEGLHWDGDAFVNWIFLTLILGQRKNIQPNSALSFLADFNQWAKDHKGNVFVENTMAKMRFNDFEKMLDDDFQKQAPHYTIDLPPNDGYTRMLLVLNDPKYGGLAHGISKPNPIDPERQMHREFRRSLTNYR